MGLKVKHVVLGLGLVAGASFYVKNRVDKLTEIMLKLIPIPTAVRNFILKNWVFSFNIDVTIHNPTTESFNPNGIIVTLKRLEVKDTLGNIIGKVNINKNSIIIPAKGEYTLKNLLVEINTYDNILNVSNLLKIKSINDIKIDIVISVLGTEHIIPQL
jgi:hypothetical protein